MKRIIFAGLMFMVFVLPTIAQVDHDYNPNDRVPVPGAALTKDQIPPAVLKALNSDFKLSDQATWCKFPYALESYGWVYDVAATDVKPDRYEVEVKTDNGHDLYAVYSPDGTLIATREVSDNSPVPDYVLARLGNSIYKDWTVVGSKEIIKYYYDKNSVEQHFRITVKKDNVTRSISFNYQAKGDNDKASVEKK